jgi:catechol 2,3-dioxygenase-like lactoylglutathione lyase family enzyme
VQLDRPSSEQLAHYSRGEKVQILTKTTEDARTHLLEWLREQGLSHYVSHVGESNAFSTLFIEGAPQLANSLSQAPGVVEVSTAGDYQMDLLSQTADRFNGFQNGNHGSLDMTAAAIHAPGEEMTHIVGIAEIVLWTADQQQSLRFYRDLLRLEVISPPELPNIFLKVGEGRAGIPQMIVLVPKPEDLQSLPSGSQLHHLAFELPPTAFDQQMHALQEAGYAPRGGKHPVLASRTMYVDDPDGNEVEFICAE